MKTEILCIVDRSGSMSDMGKEAIGGFNGFLTDQKAVPDPANFTLVLFDHEYLKIHDGKDLIDVPPMDELQYQPRGSTALLDAMGRGITEIKEKIANEMKKITDAGYTKPDAPKVVVMILTDGEENSSKEWDKKKITELIEGCKKDNWGFMFMSADMNGIADAHSYGLDAGSIISYAASTLGTKRAFAYGGANVANYRMTGQMTESNVKSHIGDTEEHDEAKS